MELGRGEYNAVDGMAVQTFPMATDRVVDHVRLEVRRPPPPVSVHTQNTWAQAKKEQSAGVEALCAAHTLRQCGVGQV